MKVRDVIKQLENDGWYLARTRGSHRHFKHPTKPGTVTVAGKMSVDVPIGRNARESVTKCQVAVSRDMTSF